MTPEVALTLPWGYIHVYYHSSQISLLVSQVSGERLQDHWSSGCSGNIFLIAPFLDLCLRVPFY